MLAITLDTWGQLTAENRKAHDLGWAQLGVFATGIGPDYVPGGRGSILYVGKSAGPLGSLVGSVADQLTSSRASSEWMVSRRNKSAFWQLAERFDATRRSLAWTNICKMDRIGGQVPPTYREWDQISGLCRQALREEIVTLRPSVTLFAISSYLRAEAILVLLELGYAPGSTELDDGWTTVFTKAGGQTAVLTKHPQGWPLANRERLVGLVRALLSG